MADRQAPAEREPSWPPEAGAPPRHVRVEVGGGEGGVALDVDFEVGASDAVEVDSADVLAKRTSPSAPSKL